MVWRLVFGNPLHLIFLVPDLNCPSTIPNVIKKFCALRTRSKLVRHQCRNPLHSPAISWCTRLGWVSVQAPYPYHSVPTYGHPLCLHFICFHFQNIEPPLSIPLHTPKNLNQTYVCKGRSYKY